MDLDVVDKSFIKNILLKHQVGKLPKYWQIRLESSCCFNSWGTNNKKRLPMQTKELNCYHCHGFGCDQDPGDLFK